MLTIADEGNSKPFLHALKYFSHTSCITLGIGQFNTLVQTSVGWVAIKSCTGSYGATSSCQISQHLLDEIAQNLDIRVLFIGLNLDYHDIWF